MSQPNDPPPNFVVDLIGYVDQNKQHLLMAVISGDDVLWNGTPVPYDGACFPICRELTTLFKAPFPTYEDAENWFVVTHVRNMRDGKNLVGMKYPIKELS
jgi:hypothetical protein